jgi:hypothetical protein
LGAQYYVFPASINRGEGEDFMMAFFKGRNSMHESCELKEQKAMEVYEYRLFWAWDYESFECILRVECVCK